MNSKICQVLKLSSKYFSDIEDLRNPMHQSDVSMNFDEIDEDLQRLLDDTPGTIPLHNVTLMPVTPLTKS
ncbi:hypothetical protein RclHR1_07640005 [Rhizophagus clarus]|uniref:Uncharacterized protein n=1 Tax=Rhizophagus clarus TaxID=94130 RepID=A0A2Z6SLF0_9GLOM|nr:hypothetical protein RclHR1_07640005 [Rhizophagus clarus]GET04787.1 hypothetical protein RCL_e25288_RclHR1_07640005 [Rhizophagus clarus]